MNVVTMLGNSNKSIVEKIGLRFPSSSNRCVVQCNRMVLIIV